MNGSALNSSFSASSFFWVQCNPYDDDGGPSVGLFILYTTSVFDFLLSIPANVWLAQHILRNVSKVSGILPADFFPLSLAFIQLCFYLFVPVMFLNHYLWRNNSVEVCISLTICLMYSAKPLFLCLVCVERYMAVVRPHDYLRYKERRYRESCLAVIWCIYILTAISDFYYNVTLLVFVLFVCVLVVNTWLSVATLKALRKTPPGDRVMAEKDKKGAKKGKTSNSRGKGATDSKKRRAFITIIIIQTVLTLNYFPSILCIPLSLMVSARVLNCQFMPLAIAASTSCGYLEPLLHLHRLVR